MPAPLVPLKHFLEMKTSYEGLSEVSPMPFMRSFSRKEQPCSACVKDRHLLPDLHHLLNCKGLRESY